MSVGEALPDVTHDVAPSYDDRCVVPDVVSFERFRSWSRTTDPLFDDICMRVIK